ncbi:uncharacterized protein RJT21DRAFT_45933 [Scheffersomyces amazonensis]|uniref:uncharacterized protein n=1 Tax=Scheffersomyces amazonensis TaxID=1078765 RepID=UPI00315CE70C
MASVIVVDNELKDSVKEYAQIIDGLNQNQEFSESLTPLLGDDEQIKDGKLLIEKIYEVSSNSTLSKLSDREFEPTFYLLIHILSELSGESISVLDDENSPIIKLLLELNPQRQPLLRDRKSVKSTTILSVLTNIFNLIPETSTRRIFIINQILSIVKNANLEFNLIEENIGNNLINWLTKAQASESDIKSIFWNFISLDSEYSLKSLQFIKSFTLQFPLSIQELHNLIKFALSSPIVDVSFLITNNVAQALHANAQDSLALIFNKFVQGELVKLSESIEDLSIELINEKSRILALAKFFSEKSQLPDHDSIVFKYDEIPSELISNVEDFELLLVNSIKANVIEGKLNQLESTFYLTRVNRFVIAGNEQTNTSNWNEVRQVLYEWKNSLTNINEIVKSTRENIVNNGSA